MVRSKPWDWNKNENEYWEVPAEEVVPIVLRWKEKGFKKALDLGCGLGRHSILMAKKGFDVDAFDLSREGLDKFKDKIKNRKLKIKIKFGDMLRLPYREESFDCILSFHTIQHTDMAGLKKIVQKIHKTLKPGGEAYLTMLSKEDYSWKKDAKNRINSHTLIKNEGTEINVPHTYLKYGEVTKLFKNFRMVRVWQLFKYTPEKRYAHFYVLAKK